MYYNLIQRKKIFIGEYKRIKIHCDYYMLSDPMKYRCAIDRHICAIWRNH